MSRETAVADGAIEDLAELGVLAFCRVVGGGAPEATARTVVPIEALRNELSLHDGLASLRGYDSIVLAHPELVVLEALAASGHAGRVVAFLPPLLGDERMTSIRANVPERLDVTFLDAAEAPVGVSPAAATFLTVGFQAGGGYALVPWWTADLLHAWRHRWFGRSLLLDSVGVPVRSRPLGWTSVPIADHFTAVVGPTDAAEDLTTDTHVTAFEERSA